MLLTVTILLAVVVLAYTLLVRAKDLPEPVPMSPFQHLDERRAQIYENLRDLSFEYRVGKLSDADYQQTKQGLQQELAGVLAEIDVVKEALAAKAAAGAKATPAVKSKAARANGSSSEPAMRKCPHCGAQFAQALRFCGECGKPMAAEVQA